MKDRFRLGHVWRLRGRPELALPCYREAARQDPAWLPAWVAWAGLLVEQGELREAAEVYQEALGHHPQDLGLASALARLRRPDPSETAVPVAGSGPGILLYTDCPTYGAGEISHSLVRAWLQAGYRVTVAQPRASDGLLERRQALGIPHVFLQPDDLYDLRQEPGAFTGHDEARAVLRAVAPELVVFADGCPFSNLAAKEAAAERNVPAAAIVHAVQPGWSHTFCPYLARLQSRYAALRDVVAVSRENLACLRTGFGLRGGRVIRNGRPARFFQPGSPNARSAGRRRLGVAEHELLVLTVASLESRKGYPYLVRCARELEGAPIHFAWVGAGSLEAQLREHTWGLPVSFLGEQEDVAPWLDACDAFALLSEWEGMPLSVLEAMARGKPVLATAVSGIPEALGRTGRLLPDPRLDPAATVRAAVEGLQDWQAHPEHRLALGRAARRRAQRAFREERMLARYLGWTRELLGREG